MTSKEIHSFVNKGMPPAIETELRTPESSVMTEHYLTGTFPGNSAVFTFTENNTLRNVKFVYDELAYEWKRRKREEEKLWRNSL